jgi:hypothetical protein
MCNVLLPPGVNPIAVNKFINIIWFVIKGEGGVAGSLHQLTRRRLDVIVLVPTSPGDVGSALVHLKL